MTLVELRTKLSAAATGTDIEQVLFDWSEVLNRELTKSYPLIFWEIPFLSGVKQVRTTQKEESIQLRVFCIKEYTPDDDKLADYDSLVADLEEYLHSLNEDTKVQVVMEDVPWEVYDEAYTSVDREIGVSYTLTLNLWC